MVGVDELPRPTLSDVGLTEFAISGPLLLAAGLFLLNLVSESRPPLRKGPSLNHHIP